MGLRGTSAADADLLITVLTLTDYIDILDVLAGNREVNRVLVMMIYPGIYKVE